VGISWLGKSAFVQTNTETLCPSATPPSEILVLLLDMSDEFTEPQRLQILNELERFRSDVRQFGLIEVYAVDRIGERITKPVQHLCNPGSDADVNRLYQNPKMARERWESFSAKLEEELARLMATNESSTSPIFEAIQSTALRTFNLPRHDGIPKRLVLVSDLMQNVPGKLTQYRSTIAFSELKASSYFAEVRADLDGVAVHLVYLIRSAQLQDPRHLVFWEQYLIEQGATVESVAPVYGGN
jgi:hypothetical protein